MLDARRACTQTRTVTEATKAFRDASAYETYMGAWSRPLAQAFAAVVGVAAGDRVLDVGCGTGALTEALVERVGSGSVAALDPSEQFMQACSAAAPTADVRLAGAEAIPFEDAGFDASLSQLVVNFMTDALAGVREMGRVTRANGTVAACTWDYRDGMTMLRVFWDAAAALDPTAPHEGRMPYCDRGSLERLWRAAELDDVQSGELTVTRTYEDFDDFWSTFELGVGPGGAYCLSLAPQQRSRVRKKCFQLLGEPEGPMPMSARAWVVTGTR
jgi:SAM-dependent methyltransferase